MKKQKYHDSYFNIFDEFGQLCRWVRTKEEAEKLISIYEDWTYTYVPTNKKPFKFEDAPF
jgi:hypothetical protein